MKNVNLSISANFSSSFMIKQINLFTLHFNGFYTCIFSFLAVCNGHLENINSLNFTNLLNVEILLYKISMKELMNPIISSGMTFKNSQVIKLSEANISYAKF